MKRVLVAAERNRDRDDKEFQSLHNSVQVSRLLFIDVSYKKNSVQPGGKKERETEGFGAAK
jgi:hypothetical protein